jgi:hypothetical protein
VKVCKKTLTKELKVSRSSLYYKHLQPEKDERLRILIECCMKEHPANGYRRVAQCLKINHKQAQRVMQKYNLKPARRCKTPSKPDDLRKDAVSYPDITSVLSPIAPDYIGYKPEYFHSDQESEYTSNIFTTVLKENNTSISCSPKSSPWRNGALESFFGRFKVEFCDPDRFETLSELIEAIYLQVDHYNTKRIHSLHKTQPEKGRLRFNSVYANIKLSTPVNFPPSTPFFANTT